MKVELPVYVLRKALISLLQIRGVSTADCEFLLRVGPSP